MRSLEACDPEEVAFFLPQLVQASSVISLSIRPISCLVPHVLPPRCGALVVGSQGARLTERLAAALHPASPTHSRAVLAAASILLFELSRRLGVDKQGPVEAFLLAGAQRSMYFAGY